MPYSLIVRPEAEIDIAETYAWYEVRGYALGRNFLEQIEAALRFLAETPLAFPERYRDVRQYVIRRFPYKVLYRVEAHGVIVLAVTYAGRNPEWLRKRLSDA